MRMQVVCVMLNKVSLQTGLSNTLKRIVCEFQINITLERLPVFVVEWLEEISEEDQCYVKPGVCWKIYDNI